MAIQKDSFPERVKKVRTTLGLSQEELAHELGVSFSTINRWENRQTKPIKLARLQFEVFCKRKIEEGKLEIEVKD
ncbi:MAG: helix-turn-helix transcriptional regulator [Spirochaetales bacterium]|nr:helix-turn-helix transcriptional regulator [Spirochaetales bacterium]